MKPKNQIAPSPPKPSESEAERFRDFARQIISVPKAEIDKQQAEYKRQAKSKKS